VSATVESWITRDPSGQQFGMWCEGRAHQEAAVAGPTNCQPVGRGVLLLDKPFGGGNEIVEDVLLLLEHARVMPGFAKLSASTQVRQGIDAAARNPCRRPGIEPRLRAQVKPAITGEQCC